MKINMGIADRNFRFIMGIVIIGLGIFFKSWWGALGIIPLATSFMRFCPLYLPFGISTNKSGEE